MGLQRTATLRTCASCEWIFKEGVNCPKCGFGSYGARYVYGDKCYHYAYIQKPWKDKMMTRLAIALELEIMKCKHPTGKSIKQLKNDGFFGPKEW